MLADPAAEEFKYPYDLSLFVHLELPELVVEYDDRLRLHEKSGSRRGLVMHHAREQAYILPLYRDHISAVSHGDYRVLKVRLRGPRAYHLLQTGLYEIVLVADVAPYGSQLRRGAVRHLILADYRARNVLLEFCYRIEQACYLGYDLQSFRHVSRQECLYLA